MTLELFLTDKRIICNHRNDSLPKQHFHAEYAPAAFQEFISVCLVNAKAGFPQAFIDIGAAFLNNDVLAVGTGGVAGKKVLRLMLGSLNNMVKNSVNQLQPLLGKGFRIDEYRLFIEYAEAGIEVVKIFADQLKREYRKVE